MSEAGRKTVGRPWRIALAVLGGLVALVVGTLAALLYLPAFDRMVIGRGAAAYDARIPGHVEHGAIEGSLARGLVIRDVRLTDAAGAELVTVGELRLRLTASALLAGDVDVGAAMIRDGAVNLWGEASGGFRDLAPRRDEPRPPRPQVGPDLPLGLRVAVRAEALQLRRWDPEREVLRPLVDLERVELVALGRGLDAQAQLDATGKLHLSGDGEVEPGAATSPRTIWFESLRGEIAWSSPHAELAHLAVDADAGRLCLDGARIDVEAGYGALEQLDAVVSAVFIETQTDMAFDGDPRLALRGAGTLHDASASATLEVPGTGVVSLGVDGRLGRSTDVAVAVDAVVQPRTADPVSVIAGGLRLRRREHRDESGELRLDGRVACVDCDPKGGPVRATVALRRRLGDASGTSGTVELDARGLHLAVDAIVDATRHLELALTGRARDLRALDTIAARFVDTPGLSGRAWLDARCGGALQPRDLRCALTGGLEDGAPVERAAVDLTATLDGDELQILVERLEAAARGVSLTQRGQATAVAEGLDGGPPTRVRLAGLDLAVATADTQARVRAEGTFDRRKGRDSDMRIDVDGLELAALKALSPELDVGGTVDANARITGDARSPSITAELRGRRLRYRDVELRTLGLDANYRPGRLEAQLEAGGGVARRLEVEGALPLQLELAGEDTEPVTIGEAWRLSVRGRGVNLAELAQLVPSAPKTRGKVALDVDARGGAHPRLDGTVRGRDLRFDGRGLGTLELGVNASARAGVIDLDWRHADLGDVVAHAEVPLALDLRPRSFKAELGHGEIMLAFALSNARLGPAMALLPSSARSRIGELRGRGAVAVDLRGDLRHPEIEVFADLGRLRWRGHRVGRVRLDAAYVDARATGRLRARGPTVGQLRADADVPVSLRLDGQASARWHRRRPHHLDVGIGDLQVGRLASWFGETPPVGGTAFATAELHGGFDAPRVSVDAAVQDFSFEEHYVGDVSLHAGHEGERLEAELVVRHDARRKIAASGMVPMQVDLARGAVRWLEHERHELHVDVDRLDHEFMAAFREFPDALTFDGNLEVDVDGAPRGFDLSAKGDGFVAVDGHRQPFELDGEVHDDVQDLTFVLGDGRIGAVSLDAHAQLPGVAMYEHFSRAVEDRRAPGRVSLTQAPLEVKLDARGVELGYFSGLLPPTLYDLRGRLSSTIEVTGELGNPRFSGETSVEKGALTVVPLRQRLRDVAIVLDFDEDGARIEKVRARAGGGKLKADGELHVRGGRLEATVAAVADDIPVLKPGLPRMRVHAEVDGELKVGVKRTDVALKVHDSRVEVEGTNVAAPDDIPESEDLLFTNLHPEEVLEQYEGILVDEAVEALEDETHGGADGAGEDGDDTALAAGLELERVDTGILGFAASMSGAEARGRRVAVRIADTVKVRGPSIDMDWDGKIEVQRDGGERGDDATNSSGHFEAERGNFELLGNAFEVTRGRVTIPPGHDMMPYIDLAAKTSVDEYEITAKIKGRATRPEFHLSSVPAADEATIFGMLISGTSDPEEGPEATQKAASVLAAFSTPTLQRQLNETLRIDKLGLGFGDTASQPVLTVGKHLSDDVYVETSYQFGADPADPTENQAEVLLRYGFAPHWNLQTQFGDAPAGSVGVYWRKSFDVRPKPWWIDPSILRPARRRPTRDDAVPDARQRSSR